MKKPDLQQSLLRRPPLYQQAAEMLRSLLGEMKPGERLPTEKVLAMQYGISLTTLREAVRILAAEGLVLRKQGLGTFVSDRQGQRKGWVALLIHHDVSYAGISSFYLHLAQEVRANLDEKGIPTRLYISRRAPGLEQFDFHCPEFFEDLNAGQVVGVVGVLLAGQVPWLKTLKERGILLTGHGSYKEYAVSGSVREFYQKAVRELHGRGRTRLALMAWGGYESDRSHHSEIFRAILKEEGLPFVEPWIKDDTYPALEGAGWELFREIWSALPEKPDGLIVSDDHFLEGVTAAVHEGNIAIPQQLEIATILSNPARPRHRFPIIAWQTDTPSIARVLADVQARLWRGETVEPEQIRIPSVRVPELEAPISPARKTRTPTIQSKRTR